MSDHVSAENTKLRGVVRKLQDHISTLRDEVKDANAEIVALRRLSDEQKQILLVELDKERALRIQAEKEVLKRQQNAWNRPKTREAATNTASVHDVSVSATEEPQPVLWNKLRYVGQPVPKRDNEALRSFADYLSRSVDLRSTDLASLLVALGGMTVEDVCANLTEADLRSSGIPPLQCRGIMTLVAQQTAEILKRGW